MSREERGYRKWLGSAGVLAAVVLLGGGLTAWKTGAIRAAEHAAASQPEPVESVTAAVAKQREHRQTTTSIGTVLALRSVTLRNEVPGTVHEVALTPGAIVERGDVLVALDASVEEAELEAQRAEAELARTTLDRLRRLSEHGAVSQEELDQARAEHEVAVAEIARIEAIIARKTIRAPFRARVGIADVHPGQYIDAGTQLTTLQGVGDEVHVDFAVAQRVAAQLRPGDVVEVWASGDRPLAARIVAVDARVDPSTRNAMVRARLSPEDTRLSPGASVRVEVPVGPAAPAVVVPVTALRKGPAGDHVFVLSPDANGQVRAHVRPVRSGPVLSDNEVVILAGLEPGERIAALGSFKLREAAPVMVAEAAASATAAGGAQ